MIDASFTAHAGRRCQQRAIPPMVVELLERCGSERRCGQADRLFFDKAAKKRLRQHLGGKRGLQLIERWMSVYAVIGDNGRVITVAHSR
ncbi:hypothetical protein LGH83_08175 [Lichenihabitans sp. PAMC28606]|uniref:hypothetical protein n=1 Tax=Lichenihabitans sp. PAMC28606 TaxID=2880932 RepID=UPI001D0B0A10|nr:hypothetical protein [Lichenihabitans sp. PAMC28606]UDL96146.1 hypothetical protein LGH83_08175 [Lichenihabitans sp. PAMC28606]